ncbi:uncharacterized protein si:dkeyp-110g5.4 [Dicentrarchus labrax]|uniref:uncharacterized protein si:dkeyp-110g5.4 n=1 Tax=Dicentrarchus labrax TaxID=13489 RepID=UPI0021F62728|nr:uncharacterized protein si:dkeyp-110g5.4 [Dicentrarchus labrax]XP_051282358.1 uncharacterized protein si:dkeyp-110g5.4 [Dicentrarchus labrax]
MELFESLEIYIPVEAEVKSICLWSLPNSVLRRMGLPLSDAEGCRTLTESPEGIWICPAVLRKKGQKPSHARNSVIENVSSLMAKEFRAAPGPFRMSFVASNHAAYKVLKDTMPGKKVAANTSPLSHLSPGSVPLTYQNAAVVIYHGRIYLSIRKPNHSRSRRETREPQPASKSSFPSTSDVSAKSQTKHQSPQASLQPANKQLQRKRLRIPLPQTSPKQPKVVLTKTDSTTDQELLNPKKKHTTPKVTQSENRKHVTHKGRDVPSSKTAAEATASEPAWFQPQAEQGKVADDGGEIQDLGDEESANQNVDGNLKADCGEPDSIVEQSSGQSWTRRESQGAASTSLQHDFEELAQEEMIARMKAKLRQSEAALSNLHSS